jgi:hypothetical protein
MEPGCRAFRVLAEHDPHRFEPGFGKVDPEQVRVLVVVGVQREILP